MRESLKKKMLLCNVKNNKRSLLKAKKRLKTITYILNRRTVRFRNL